MRAAPFWPDLEAIAPTLAYDHREIMGATTAVPNEELAGVEVPVLAICGDASPAFMCATAHTMAGRPGTASLVCWKARPTRSRRRSSPPC